MSVASIALEIEQVTVDGLGSNEARSMARHIEATDPPEDIARTAEAQVAAGRFASVEDVVAPASKRSQPSSKSASLCAPRCKRAS